MTYYRGERSTNPIMSGGEPLLRSRTGVVVHSSRTGQVVYGGATNTSVLPDERLNYPRVRSASDSTVATAAATVVGGLDIDVNPAFLIACRDGDDNRLRQLMTSRTLTAEMVNCRDRTGKTGVNLICANGNLSLLQLICTIPSLDINLGDNEGNTPLHFVSQAGHVEVLHFLLNQFHNLHVDARNNLGFTALMKASLQGRTKCVKLLLAAGASCVLRDSGRGLCAFEWARFCSRQSCAEVIEKFMKNCNYSPSTLRKSLKDLEKWNSEPNLQFFNFPISSTESKDNWLKQKLKRALFNRQSTMTSTVPMDRSGSSRRLADSLTHVGLCASSAIVPTSSNIKSANNNKSDCSNGDVSSKQISLPKVQVTAANSVSSGRHYTYN
ncbi:hypothetical protein CHUAL_009592 [Chamberlinius hualienensis]